MRLPSWPPIPQQQVENNTLLFFFSWYNVQDSPRQRAALSLVQGGTQIGFISDSASPGDSFGRPHQAWQETFYSPSSEPLRHRPASLQAVVFVATGVRSHFATVVLSLSILAPGWFCFTLITNLPGQTAGICVWLHTVWLMSSCGLLCFYQRWEVTKYKYLLLLSIGFLLS